MFFHVLKNEIKRGLKKWTLYVSFLICLFIYYISFSQLDWINIVKYPMGSVVYRHNTFLMEFNPCRTLLPFAAVLPFCAAVAEDWEHRTIYLQSTRCSFTSYCLAKFISSGLFGGAVLSLGLFVFLGFLKIYLPFCEDVYEAEEFIHPLLIKNQWGCYLMYFISLQFFLGFFCAGVGCITAAVTNRRGMIYLSALLLLAMLEIVTNITLVGLSGGQSSIIFRMKNQKPSSAYLMIAGIFIALTGAAYVVFHELLKRRLYKWQ